MPSSTSTPDHRRGKSAYGRIALALALAGGVVVGCFLLARGPASDAGVGARKFEIAPAMNVPTTTELLEVEAPAPKVEASERAPVPAVREPAPVARPAGELDLLEKARELARGDAAAREKALMAYARAEDALRGRMDEVYVKRDQPGIDAVEPVYRQCIEESDALVYALLDDARIESTPWRDLLSTPPVVGHDGLARYENANHAIAAATTAGSDRQGILSIGDLEQWRDFVLETEFTFLRGETQLYWRLGKQVAAAPDEVVVSESAELRAGETYTLTATYLGSRRTFTWSANAGRDPEQIDPIGWRRSRVGAFAAVLGEDAEIRITGLRIRVLRAGR